MKTEKVGRWLEVGGRRQGGQEGGEGENLFPRFKLSAAPDDWSSFAHKMGQPSDCYLKSRALVSVFHASSKGDEILESCIGDLRM